MNTKEEAVDCTL